MRVGKRFGRLVRQRWCGAASRTPTPHSGRAQGTSGVGRGLAATIKPELVGACGAAICYTGKIRTVSLDLFWNGDTRKYPCTRTCLSLDDRSCEERKLTETYAFSRGCDALLFAQVWRGRGIVGDDRPAA